jgi:hypothetical protein
LQFAYKAASLNHQGEGNRLNASMPSLCSHLEYEIPTSRVNSQDTAPSRTLDAFTQPTQGDNDDDEKM